MIALGKFTLEEIEIDVTNERVMPFPRTKSGSPVLTRFALRLWRRLASEHLKRNLKEGCENLRAFGQH